jgi:hypothetical protein
MILISCGAPHHLFGEILFRDSDRCAHDGVPSPDDPSPPHRRYLGDEGMGVESLEEARDTRSLSASLRITVRARILLAPDIAISESEDDVFSAEQDLE